MTNPDKELRIALTGFMGVGKSTVSRHLGRVLRAKHIDLDDVIEHEYGKTIAELVDGDGLESFRRIETEQLERVLDDDDNRIISLGGGAFVTPGNRTLIESYGVRSIWLEATFAHCWANISLSYKKRPLARNRKDAKVLFEERSRFYCLAEWHFLIMSGCNSYDVADQIAEQVFGFHKK